MQSPLPLYGPVVRCAHTDTREGTASTGRTATTTSTTARDTRDASTSTITVASDCSPVHQSRSTRPAFAKQRTDILLCRPTAHKRQSGTTGAVGSSAADRRHRRRSGRSGRSGRSCRSTYRPGDHGRPCPSRYFAPATIPASRRLYRRPRQTDLYAEVDRTTCQEQSVLPPCAAAREHGGIAPRRCCAPSPLPGTATAGGKHHYHHLSAVGSAAGPAGRIRACFLAADGGCHRPAPATTTTSTTTIPRLRCHHDPLDHGHVSLFGLLVARTTGVLRKACCPRQRQKPSPSPVPASVPVATTTRTEQPTTRVLAIHDDHRPPRHGLLLRETTCCCCWSLPPWREQNHPLHTNQLGHETTMAVMVLFYCTLFFLCCCRSTCCVAITS